MPQSEGDLPRMVDMDEQPLLTHNQQAVDESYPASGVSPSPRGTEYGTSDQQQMPGSLQADRPHAPLGPDTLSGGRLTNVPTPPTPRADHTPTAAGAGMYGEAAEADAHSPAPGDDET